MKKYELIKAMSSVLDVCEKSGIKPADAKYVALYEDFERMKREGHKFEFICYYLGERYEVSKVTVWRIVKRFGEDIVI